MDDTAPPLAPLDAPNGEGNGGPTGYPHGDDGEWLSINAAARRLGVTATAIRNRIKRGTLQARPNGNFGKLVRVPLTVPVTVIPTPQEPVRVTVPLTPEASVPLTVTLTALSDHITSLKTALAKAEGELVLLRPERERADRLEVEVAVIPGLQEANEALKETIEVLKATLETEQGRLAEARADRDRLRDRPWWQRLVNG